MNSTEIKPEQKADENRPLAQQPSQSKMTGVFYAKAYGVCLI